MHAVIFAGGTLRPGKAVTAALTSADIVLAADNGAATALTHGHTPAIVVGDFDSLSLPIERLETLGSTFVRAQVEKDETDTELAIQIALQRGADTITLLGAIGGARFDHTVANILLLAGFDTIPIRIVDGPSTCWLLRGPGNTLIHGHFEDLLSLLPLTGDATGVKTTGLYYPLTGETLRFGKPRGMSNKLTHEEAQVSLEHGMLLVIHTNVQELVE